LFSCSSVFYSCCPARRFPIGSKHFQRLKNNSLRIDSVAAPEYFLRALLDEFIRKAKLFNARIRYSRFLYQRGYG
jgi:hypothetical protein